MSLKPRVYSVLVVSAAEKVTQALCELLPASRYAPVRTSSSISAAKRALAEREYDYVIINSPLPDDTGARFAINISNTKSTVVLLLIRAELYGEIRDKVAEHGVFTLAKPLTKSTLVTALDWLSSARERLRRFERQTLSVKKKMEEIRLINRAKWILIRKYHMEETEAHRYVEKQAMDRCVSKRTVAEEIIENDML